MFVTLGSQAFSFQENPLTKAIQLFDKEKFAEAEPLFKNILDKRPDDFMVNYFYGACRTENGHYGMEELNYLIKASKEVNPLNIDYYLAVQYHAKNQWEKALSYYNLYKKVASENEQENVGLALKIEQCTSQKNPFVSPDVAQQEESLNVATVGVVETETVSTGNVKQEAAILSEPLTDVFDTINTEKETTELKIEDLELENDTTIQNIETEQGALPVQIEENVTSVNIVPEKKIKFIVNSEITYISLSNFKTNEGRAFFDEGTAKEKELEKIMIRTENLRGNYKSSQSRAERDSLGEIILSLESEAFALKSTVNNIFMQAKNAENSYWVNASPDETESFVREFNAVSQQTNKANRAVEMPKTSELIIPPILIQDEEVSSSTKKEKSTGITYKVQIGAYSRGIPSSQKSIFNKISIIRKVDNYTDENGVVVYTTGNLTNYDDALQMQKQVQQEGVKDPKIAAYLNGKRITLEKAKEIENNQ